MKTNRKTISIATSIGRFEIVPGDQPRAYIG